MTRFCWAVWIGVLGLLPGGTDELLAQADQPYGSANTFSLGAEYSNNSSKIVGGEASQRKWAAAVLGYRRVLAKGHGASFAYIGEIRPLLFESDPVTLRTTTYSGALAVLVPPPVSIEASCTPGVQNTSIVDPSGNPAGNLVVTTHCGRRWTYGGAVSPIGFQANGLTKHRLQPYLLGTLGVLLTTRPVPAEKGTAANYLIQVGAGLELYRTSTRSFSVDYRVQHFSNHDRSDINPGVDSQVVYARFNFGH